MIDPAADRPVYRQIADDLRESIASGRYRPGSWLPSATRLQQEHGVGRETVRRALAVLVREGLVAIVAGRGTQVCEPPERRPVAVPRGATVIARPPTPQERIELELPEGELIFIVSIGGRERKYGVDSTMLTVA